MPRESRNPSYLLFEETVEDHSDIVVFKYPSRYARFKGAEKIFLSLLVVSGIFVFAHFYAATAQDRGDRWALYGAALFLSLPMLISIKYFVTNLWTRRAVIIHPIQRTISEVTRTPFREWVRHHPIAEVSAVRLFHENSATVVVIELFDDTVISLGVADEKDNALALARRAAAMLRVGLKESELDEPTRASAP